MLRRTAAVLMLAVVLAGCSSGSRREVSREGGPVTSTAPAPADTAAPAVAPPTTAGYPISTVAVARPEVSTVEIFDGPKQAEATRSLSNPHPTYGTPRVFLVRERAENWLRVLLPMRPNGSEGWIRAGDVTLSEHPYRIVVELEAKRLTAYNGNELILDEPVGLGRGNTPTPGGVFYTTELFDVLPEQPEYGPYAFGLSGYSEVHLTFTNRFGDVGDGQFAIHGTNDPSSIGRDVTNGCIRMYNEAITRLADMLPNVGVPVEIRA